MKFRRRAAARALFPFAISAALAAGFAPTSAHANGRFPAANHLVVKPNDPTRILLRSTFGFLYTRDSGGTWDWVCEKAIGYSGAQDPAVALTANGSTLAGLFTGLAVGAEPACGWSIAGGPLAKQAVIDVAVRPDAPHIGVAITGTNTGQTDAGASIFNSQILETTDDGASWRALGAPLDPSLIVETVDVTASDPNRIYVSAIRGEGATTGAFLLTSRDHGATWEQHVVPLDLANERAPFIAAVDPQNADRVYVRTSGVTTSRLLVTDDAGKTFRAVYSGGKMLGFALSPDGAKVFLGGPLDGLQMATRDALVFTQRSLVQIECLMTSGPLLYACSNEASGFIVGASTDDGATFTAKLRLSTVHGPLTCPTGSNGAACLEEWPALRDQLGIVEDAGTASADAGKPAASASGNGGGCGCNALGGCAGGLTGTGVAFVVAALVYARRRQPRS